MFIEGLFDRGSLGVMQKAMAFAEQRHQVLANNIANIDTVGYKMQDLSVKEFKQALFEASQVRQSRGSNASLHIRKSRHFQYGRQGHLQTKPASKEDNNILFHDQKPIAD